MNFETFNLNDHVRVKLNDLGFVTWKQEFEKYLPEQYHKPLSDFVARADAEGYVDFQAWNFINLFGEHVYMAGPSLFDLTILIQRPDSNPLEPPAPRPLSSLTEEEIVECARLLNDDVKRWTDVEYRAFGKSRCIYSGYTVVRLIRYLDSLGIALGE